MLLAAVQDADALAALSSDIDGLAKVITDFEPKQAEEAIKAVESKIGGIVEASSIRSAVSKVRRALKGRTADPEKALAELQKAKALFDEEVAWRQMARQTIGAKLSDYEAAIRNTIGLRLQDRLPHNAALDVAACQSNHVDISLHF